MSTPILIREPASAGTNSLVYPGSLDKNHAEVITHLCAKNLTKGYESVTFYLQSKDGHQTVILDDGPGVLGRIPHINFFKLSSQYQIAVEFDGCTAGDMLELMLVVG